MSTPKNGIDVDRAPPNVAIAYDRYEGYFGPAYETGALAPVVARLESNTSVFAPKIRQLYATGDAAALVTQEPTRSHEKAAKSTDKRVAFFGTGSVVGLKVAFDPNGTPQSLTLGYKRKEFSLISGALKPTPFYYDQCSATLENWLNKDKKDNANALNNWINKNGKPGCDIGGDLMYTETCKDLCHKAASDLATE